MNAPARKPANLTLDAALLAEAKTLRINVSRAAEAGVRAAVADVRAAARRLNRENPHAGIWLTGCSAQTHAEQMKTLPGVSALIPAGLKDELLNNPEKWLADFDRAGN